MRKYTEAMMIGECPFWRDEKSLATLTYMKSYRDEHGIFFYAMLDDGKTWRTEITSLATCEDEAFEHMIATAIYVLKQREKERKANVTIEALKRKLAQRINLYQTLKKSAPRVSLSGSKTKKEYDGMLEALKDVKETLELLETNDWYVAKVLEETE